MGNGYGFMLANALANVACEVFQRIARLGEDQELAALACRLVDHRRLVQDFPYFGLKGEPWTKIIGSEMSVKLDRKFSSTRMLIGGRPGVCHIPPERLP